jgi:hypothetical protein
MDEFDHQLRLADTAEAADCRHLTDRRLVACLERTSEDLQNLLASHEQGVASDRHMRTHRQRCQRRHHLQRHFREASLGLRQPRVADRCRCRLLVRLNDWRRLQSARENLAQIVLQAILEHAWIGVFVDKSLRDLERCQVSLDEGELLLLLAKLRVTSTPARFLAAAVEQHVWAGSRVKRIFDLVLSSRKERAAVRLTPLLGR